MRLAFAGPIKDMNLWVGGRALGDRSPAGGGGGLFQLAGSSNSETKPELWADWAWAEKTRSARKPIFFFLLFYFLIPSIQSEGRRLEATQSPR